MQQRMLTWEESLDIVRAFPFRALDIPAGGFQWTFNGRFFFVRIEEEGVLRIMEYV